MTAIITKQTKHYLWLLVVSVICYILLVVSHEHEHEHEHEVATTATASSAIA